MAKRDYKLSPKEQAAAPLRNPMWEHMVEALAQGGNKATQQARKRAIDLVGQGQVFATARAKVARVA